MKSRLPSCADCQETSFDRWFSLIRAISDIDVLANRSIQPTIAY
jgi:hypothetical protein